MAPSPKSAVCSGPLVAAFLAAALSTSCATMEERVAAGSGDAEAVRAAERSRLRALVDADMAAATPLHAADFQVINPLGLTASRDQYLQYVGSGTVDYLSWDPEEIDVRQRGRMAAIRYRSRVEMIVRGQRLAPTQAWNTGLYERRDGRWQLVWFQVTEIAGRAG